MFIKVDELGTGRILINIYNIVSARRSGGGVMSDGYSRITTVSGTHEVSSSVKQVEQMIEKAMEARR